MAKPEAAAEKLGRRRPTAVASGDNGAQPPDFCRCVRARVRSASGYAKPRTRGSLKARVRAAASKARRATRSLDGTGFAVVFSCALRQPADLKASERLQQFNDAERQHSGGSNVFAVEVQHRRNTVPPQQMRVQMRASPYFIPVVLGLAFANPIHTASAGIAVGIGISVPVAPPALPVYTQPPIPAAGYIWTPGYWAYNDVGGYYWVPGTWVRPPSVGLLWTPPYWGFVNGVYTFNAGYWGPHVGFYGGINYGFGYGGVGFEGGFWQGGVFSYNRAVNNFGNTNITNVYNKTVINNNASRTSFNGGTGGVQAKPTSEEEAAQHEQHVQATAEQAKHVEAAKANPALRAASNHGNPAIAATAKAGELSGPGVVAAKAANHRATAANAGKSSGPATHVAAKAASHRATASAAGKRYDRATRVAAEHAPAHHKNAARAAGSARETAGKVGAPAHAKKAAPTQTPASYKRAAPSIHGKTGPRSDSYRSTSVRAPHASMHAPARRA